MRIRNPYLFAGILAFIFISCQKEASLELPNNSPGNSGGNGGSGGSSNGSEIGSWKFVGMQASTMSTVEYKAAGEAIKSITYADYTTQNNTGTAKFDGSNMTVTGLSYSVDTTERSYIYYNGVLSDSAELPFTASVPTVDESGTYKKIGTDSLYFQSGIFSQLNSNGTTQSLPAGYKLKYAGDKMFMTLVYDEVQYAPNQLGISSKITIHAVTITTLQKQ